MKIERQWFYAKLSNNDDPGFWDALLGEIERLVGALSIDSRSVLYLEIGVCSHWLRPHQSRWRASGGFAWPSGYGGGPQSRSGLPEFDWSVLIRVTAADIRVVDRRTDQRYSTLRVAAPNRTIQHEQAAVNVNVAPASPAFRTLFLAFRKSQGGWSKAAEEVIAC